MTEQGYPREVEIDGVSFGGHWAPGSDEEGRLIMALVREVSRQDELHPAGFPATRDGIRLAIAVAADDELNHEAYEAWRAARCKCPIPQCDHADWSEVAGEMLQAMAVVFRCVRSIKERETRKANERAHDVE